MLNRERWVFRWRSRLAALVLIPAASVAVLSAPRIAEGSWLDLCRDALGWVAFVAGTTLRFWATLYIGGRKAETLVSDGPYSICRNPLYLGSLLLGLSVGLFLNSLFFAAAIGLVIAAYAGVVVPAEEEFLRARHGKVYARYCEEVPRFWPRLSHLRTPEVIEVKLRDLWREASRAAWWIWLPLLGEVVVHLRAQPWWPTLFRLP